MTVTKNCFLCLQYIWLKVCPIFGTLVVCNIKCDHTNKPKDIREIHKSYFYAAIVLLTILLTATVSFFDILFFIQKNEINVYTVFKIITDTLLILNTIQLQICYLTLTNDRIIEIKGFMVLLESSYYHGIKTLLKVNYIKRFRKYSNIILVALIILIIGYIILVLNHMNSNDQFVYVKNFTQLYSISVDVLNLSSVGITMITYKRVITTAYENIIEAMVKRQQYQFQSCLEQIKRIQRLHSSIYVNFQRYNACTTKPCILWMLLTVSNMVLNVYIGIGTLLHPDVIAFDTSYVVVRIRITVVTTAMSSILFVFESLAKSVSVFQKKN